MNHSLKLFFKIGVVQFYRLNAGFFLFFFVLFFGIVAPSQLISYHFSLILGMLESPVILSGILVLWFLYNLKCVGFILKSLNKPENNILMNLQALSFARQSFIYGICQVILYLPVLLYSMIIACIAFLQNKPWIILLLVIYQVTTCISGIVIYLYRVNDLRVPRLLHRISLYSLPALKSPKRLSFCLFYYTAAHRKLAFIACKIASLFILNVMIVLNKEDFAIRDFILAFMVLLLLHSFFVFYYARFMEQEMSFTRNFPIPLVNRYLVYALTYCILLLPELVFLLTAGMEVMSAWIAWLFYFTGLGQLLLFTAVIYAVRLRIKAYLKLIFAIYLSSSLLLLSQEYGLFLLAEISFSFILFAHSYYRFEWQV